MIIVVTQLHVVLYMVRIASENIYTCICDTCCSSSLSSLVYWTAFSESLEQSLGFVKNPITHLDKSQS